MPVGELDPIAGIAAIPAGLAEAVRSMPLIDHHVHGTFSSPISRAAFEESIDEGSTGPVPPFMTAFDSQVGFAIRRWAAPRLGLPAHADADRYWDARSALSPAEIDRRMLADLGVERWIVDTGFSPATVGSPDDLAAASGGTSSSVARLELLAEQVIDDGGPVAGFQDRFRAALADIAPTVGGFKSIAAYRTGFDIDWSEPADAALGRAVTGWADGPSRSRLADPVVIAFLVHAAAGLRKPVQLHVGFGDRDLDLHRTDPLLLLPLLRQQSMQGTPVMLLHCYPFHRHAAYLAQAFDDVFFDLGLAINYAGAQSRQLLRESLEVGPFAKQLFSSDAFGPPELHLLGAVLWRRSIATALSGWVTEGDWSEDDAIRVATMVGHDNAARVYGF